MNIRIQIFKNLAAGLLVALIGVKLLTQSALGAPMKGERIVLLGNSLAERAQYFGHFENTLHSRFPNLELVVRNMGNLQSRVNGKKNPVWNLITSVMSSLYEMERENILERTEMGRKVYVINGGKLGRPRGTNENIQTFLNKPKTQSIIKFLNMGKSVRDISSRLGVSTSTIYKVKQYWKPEMV